MESLHTRNTLSPADSYISFSLTINAQVAAKKTILDDLLPLLQPAQAELYEDVALVEVADVTQLVELAANPKIRRFLIARPSEYHRRLFVLRTGISLLAGSANAIDVLAAGVKGHRLSEQYLILPKTAGRKLGSVRICRGNDGVRAGRTAEDGVLKGVDGLHGVAFARLGQFADKVSDDWRISAESVRRARERGITAEQILDWLRAFLLEDIPSLLETMIRNWAGGARLFLGPLLMLQITQRQACAAVLKSSRVQPFLIGHIPPDWFLVHPNKKKELERLLTELGFTITGAYRLAPPVDAVPTPAPASKKRAARRKKRTEEWDE